VEHLVQSVEANTQSGSGAGGASSANRSGAGGASSAGGAGGVSSANSHSINSAGSAAGRSAGPTKAVNPLHVDVHAPFMYHSIGIGTYCTLLHSAALVLH
jgi:hypothetical protein